MISLVNQTTNLLDLSKEHDLEALTVEIDRLHLVHKAQNDVPLLELVVLAD